MMIKKIIFYKKENLLDENHNLIIEQGSFELSDGKLILNNKKNLLLTKIM